MLVISSSCGRNRFSSQRPTSRVRAIGTPMRRANMITKPMRSTSVSSMGSPPSSIYHIASCIFHPWDDAFWNKQNTPSEDGVFDVEKRVRKPLSATIRRQRAGALLRVINDWRGIIFADDDAGFAGNVVRHRPRRVNVSRRHDSSRGTPLPSLPARATFQPTAVGFAVK